MKLYVLRFCLKYYYIFHVIHKKIFCYLSSFLCDTLDWIKVCYIKYCLRQFQTSHSPSQYDSDLHRSTRCTECTLINFRHERVPEQDQRRSTSQLPHIKESKVPVWIRTHSEARYSKLASGSNHLTTDAPHDILNYLFKLTVYMLTDMKGILFNICSKHLCNSQLLKFYALTFCKLTMNIKTFNIK